MTPPGPASGPAHGPASLMEPAGTTTTDGVNSAAGAA